MRAKRTNAYTLYKCARGERSAPETTGTCGEARIKSAINNTQASRYVRAWGAPGYRRGARTPAAEPSQAGGTDVQYGASHWRNSINKNFHKGFSLS